MLSEEYDFEFRVVLIPTASNITNELSIMKFPPESPVRQASHIKEGFEKNLDFYKPIREILKECDLINIRCINPLEPLKTIGLKAIIPEDDHLSADGHRIVSEVLAGDY